MYTTCLHCHGPLGANELVESLPIGHRLAFDARRGRLWIICSRCRQWNLTPFEERWEAVETCERLFRGTRARASTDNIGLARVTGGLELVRVGQPLRPELAAWRYGPTLRRRRQATVTTAAAGLTGILGLNALYVGGLIGSAAIGGGYVAIFAATLYGARRSWRPRFVLPDGRVRTLRPPEWSNVALQPDGLRWALRWRDRDDTMLLRERAGERALRSLLASANAADGRADEIERAVAMLDEGGGAERFLSRMARAAAQERLPNVIMLPAELRLAIEMALHDETERRALEGELAALEAEWRLAEEIARIADDLLLPDDVRARLDVARSGGAA